MDTRMMEQSLATQTLLTLNEKLDALAAQVAFLTAEAQRQQRRQQEWDELKGDLTPVALDAYRLAVEQLDEIEPHVQMEDLLHLFKRWLRNTRNLEQLLGQVESLAELGQDLSPLSQEAVLTLMQRLDEMERRGYFTFLAGGWQVMDNIVTHFTQEEVAQLGENIVLILQTVKEMTQPEIMQFMRRTVSAAREEDSAEIPSLFSLLRQLNDPAVRRGLARTMHVLKTVG